MALFDVCITNFTIHKEKENFCHVRAMFMNEWKEQIHFMEM